MKTGARLSIGQARDLALAAQGLAAPRPEGPVGLAQVRSALRRIQVLQLDAVNVMARTQFTVLFSRLGGYDPNLLHRLSGPGGELLEYWAHAAALVPMDQQPLFRHRMHDFAHGTSQWGIRRRQWAEAHAGYIAAILDEVRDRGALAASALEDPRRRQGEWWDRRSDGRRAMEWLYSIGELAAWRSANFERLYDLPERVVPGPVLGQPTPEPEEARRQLLRQAALALGVATLRDLSDYYFIPPALVRPRLAELEEAGEVVPVEVDGWEQPAWAPASLRTVPRRREEATLLSPFDSLIWQRDRDERLFGFRYRIEIYVPAPKRLFGYYVLPLLLGNELVGRFDLKADRKGRSLLVRSAHVEDQARSAQVAEVAAEELDRLRQWLGLETVTVAQQGSLARPLSLAVAAR